MFLKRRQPPIVYVIISVRFKIYYYSSLSVEKTSFYLISGCFLNHARKSGYTSTENTPPSKKYSQDNSVLEKISYRQLPLTPPWVKLSQYREANIKKVCIGILENSLSIHFHLKVHPLENSLSMQNFPRAKSPQ